jgi:ubiquinone/menaquinone biosynthesis C-methylase UbiE
MGTALKAYRGVAMEGTVASWYARTTWRDKSRFVACARSVAERVAPGGRILEVAPGPGYLAIELARTGRYEVSGLDISRSFVRMAAENAERAGVLVAFRHGDAAHMPFADGAFDFVVCMAAFKNFTDPVGALDEMYRVLKPRGRASIYDLRKDASLDAVDEEVRRMKLPRLDALVTRWTFRSFLLRNAYTGASFAALAARSRFGGCEIGEDGIGFEARLTRRG